MKKNDTTIFDNVVTLGPYIEGYTELSCLIRIKSTSLSF